MVTGCRPSGKINTKWRGLKKIKTIVYSPTLLPLSSDLEKPNPLQIFVHSKLRDFFFVKNSQSPET
jgi:hypothetical protein